MNRSSKTALILAVLLGALLGIGGYTFIYAKGYSYLSNNPTACTNCHVMRQQYDGWVKSSHRNAATCNDCHTPHNFIGKYAVKGRNGFFHSFYFTTGLFPDNIQISDSQKKVTEDACRHCHSAITTAIDAHRNAAGVTCTRCHNSVGHSETTGGLRNSERDLLAHIRTQDINPTFSGNIHDKR
jgi:cytochrome c nitrite reductase small subunit